MWRPNLHRFSSRPLKGQTWQVEEMLKLFLVIIVFGGAVVLVIAATGGLNSVLNDFCEKNPKWCGASDATDNDYKIARASVNALVCAINSVASGGMVTGSGCSEFYGNPRISAREASDSMIGMQLGTEQKKENPAVSCNEKSIIGVSCSCRYMSSYGASERIGETIHSDTESDAKKICEKRISEEGYSGQITPYVSCGQITDMECTITNFQLPQEISNAEEWIEGFGDPRFLVYYYKFPAGEEAAWSAWSEWFKGSDTLIFSSLCFSNLIFYSGYLVARPINSLIKIGEVPIESFRGIKKLSSLTKTTIKEAKSVGIDIAKATSKKELVEKLYVYSGVVALEQTENAFRLFRRIAPGTAGYTAIAAGTATIGEYADARFGTEFGKYIPNEGTLNLQEAVNKEPLLKIRPNFKINKADSYSNPTNENIVDLLMPMLLKRTGKNEFIPFYMASPCEADIEVSIKKDMRCLEYMQDLDSNFVYCENPKEISWSDRISDSAKPCGSVGVLSTWFSDEFSQSVADLVTKGMQKEFIFKDTDNDGKKDIAHDLVMGFTFSVETDQENIVCCEKTPLSGDKVYGWLEKEFCKSDIGDVVEDSLCEENLKNTGIRGTNTRPNALITKIEHTNLGDTPLIPNIDDAFMYSCHKQKIEPVLSSWGDVLLFGENQDAIICYAPLYEKRNRQELKDVLTDNDKGSVESTTSSSVISDHGIELVFNLTKSGEINDLMHILVGVNDVSTSYDNYHKTDYILLSDRNLDGKLDSVSVYNIVLHKSQYLDQSGLSAILETVPARIFSDNNFDGKAEHLSSTYCEADVLTVEPVLGDHSKENNFCYNAKREWVGIATTVAGFAIDATVKAIPTPATWLIGTATDCWLAYKTTDWSSPDWPSNDWG